MTYEREQHDHYVEPAWCIELLIAAEFAGFEGKAWDPCCGYGTIPEAFKRAGIECVGTDLIDRGYGTSGQNFLAMSPKLVAKTDVICANPPFKHALAFIRKAMSMTTDRVAMLLPLKILASQERHEFFAQEYRPAEVYVLANRASMPPGYLIHPDGTYREDDPAGKYKAGDLPKGGAVDFCWLVFQHGFRGETVFNTLSNKQVEQLT